PCTHAARSPRAFELVRCERNQRADTKLPCARADIEKRETLAAYLADHILKTDPQGGTGRKQTKEQQPPKGALFGRFCASTPPKGQKYKGKEQIKLLFER